MSETLSVIDEHMNSMGSPRTQRSNGEALAGGNRFSTPVLHRTSYIAGHETDEDETPLHTEQEVMIWTAEQVAEYLQDHGVEQTHCDTFREQEITGEVLLAMEQSSLFLKEFDLGPVGRRLKTWHKIKALQEEVRHHSVSVGMSTAATSEYSEGGSSIVDESNRKRSSTMGSSVPRALDPSRPHSGMGRNNITQVMSQAAPGAIPRQVPASPFQLVAPVSRPESHPQRPSTQSIQQMQGSRRHSSIDSTTQSAESGKRHHHKQSSDSKWQPGQAQSNPRHGHTLSTESNLSVTKRSSYVGVSASPADFDRGYFSSTEADGRSSRVSKNVLSKKTAAGSTISAHSRPTDFRGQLDGRASVVDSSEDLSAGLGASHWKLAGLRSVTSPHSSSKVMHSAQAETPVVTRLDGNNSNANGTSSGVGSDVGAFFRTHRTKIAGLRMSSDAVTKVEKTIASPPLIKDDPLHSPASFGSSAASTESKGVDHEKPDEQVRTSRGSSANLAPPSTRTAKPKTRPKAKQTTSAYTRGLERKGPAEQLANCDYSGWMKKKSGSLMTTWKPRLFVLRGRRLSYYYSDDDTEEKGLIDISFHRVLPAHKETLTGLHAQFTGAGAMPTSSKDGATQTAAEQDLKELPPGAHDGEGLFIFKLVPPRTGLAKGVNFTRPTVHYFAVNSRVEGRLWMAALMKATIDREDDGVVTTTYNQKTISLTKARARHERPPALREDTAEWPAEAEGSETNTGSAAHTGLGIGLSGKKREDAAAGAETESAPPGTAGGSTSENDSHERDASLNSTEGLDDRGRETVALNAPT